MIPRILHAVYGTPWAILPEKAEVILSFLRAHDAGARLTAEEIQARIGPSQPQPAARSSAGVAVLPLFGTIAHRTSLMTDMSGGTSVERFTAMFRQALADESVRSIVLDIDSPGGALPGVPELAAEIFAARGQKRIVAVANTLAASAAYWIATQADEVIVTPSGEVGSIGVFMLHQDESAWAEKEGIKNTFISAGKYKTTGNRFEPLTDEARGIIQARVDEAYEMFISAVARGRGVKSSEVKSGFGEGRVVAAREAKSLGMVDRIATLDETIGRLMPKARTQRVNAMLADALLSKPTARVRG